MANLDTALAVRAGGSASLTECYIGDGSITMDSGALSLHLLRCVNVEELFKNDRSGLVVHRGANVVIQGPVNNGDRLISAASMPNLNAGTVSFIDIAVVLHDGRTPSVSGPLPGTVVATLGGQNVGTWSQPADSPYGCAPCDGAGAQVYSTMAGSMTGTPLMWWDSSEVVNADGNSFRLYLLPPAAPNAFSLDDTGTQAYVSACSAQGLRPVTLGDPRYFPSVTNCGQYDCMSLPSDMGGTPPALWVWQYTGWETAALGGFPHGVYEPFPFNFQAGYNGRTEWHQFAAVHPVCGSEY